MNIELLREFCLSKKSVTEAFPFDNDTLVFKVLGKMFALTSLSNPVSVNLKCDTEKIVELRQRYIAVQPGFHMNKSHWNTVFFNQDVNDVLLCDMIDESYLLVVKGFSKKKQSELR